MNYFNYTQNIHSDFIFIFKKIEAIFIKIMNNTYKNKIDNNNFDYYNKKLQIFKPLLINVKSNVIRLKQTNKVQPDSA